MARRQEKVNELIRDLLSEVIQRDVKDPRVGFLSVTGVEASQDLSSARVFISVMGDETQQQETLSALVRARGFLRTELAHRVRSLRQVPELIFKLDDSIKTGVRVFELIDKAKREDAELAARRAEAGEGITSE